MTCVWWDIEPHFTTLLVVEPKTFSATLIVIGCDCGSVCQLRNATR